MKLEEAPADAGPANGLLVVPATAVLDSGTRRIVYVEKGGGTFEPREVLAGPRSDDVIPILQGLTVGERVVTRGGFLIDSQFQVTGHPSLFYPGGLHASMGHEHGTGEGTGKTPQAPEKPVEPSASQPHKH
jgi:Cu(I)/Ag(I) efflux system membrane fusion protein